MINQDLFLFRSDGIDFQPWFIEAAGMHWVEQFSNASGNVQVHASKGPNICDL